MHFTHNGKQSAGTTSRLAIVVLVHALVAFGLVKSFAMGHKAVDTSGGLIELFPPPVVEPPKPKPVEPPKKVEHTTPTQRTDAVVTPAHPDVQQQPDDEPRVTGGGDPQVDAPPGPAIATVVSPPAANNAVLSDGCATPEYPKAAIRNAESGTVTLSLLVGADGRVSDARIAKSSGFSDLDRAARSALSLCKFRPAMVNGVATSGWTSLDYVWTLNG
ncbi:MAG: energy transducer TonB [Pseudomonadota bacterium]